MRPEVSGERGVVGRAPPGCRSAKISGPEAAAGEAAAAGAQERRADVPGRPPFPRERSADALRRHEDLISGLLAECRAIRVELGEEGGLWSYRAQGFLVQQRLLEAEFGRVAASSAAFEGLVQSVQQAGARIERAVLELKELGAEQERRALVLEGRVSALEEHSSAWERRAERRIERIEAAASDQERRVSNCSALLGLESEEFQAAKKQRHA